MKLRSIIPAGDPHILMYAIRSGADIKSDEMLQSIISNDVSFRVTFSDVNEMELMMIINRYRNQVWFQQTKAMVMPSDIYFADAFTSNKDYAKDIVEGTLGIAQQMYGDDLIADKRIVSEYAPMICNIYDVTLNFTFLDMIDRIDKDDFAKLFTMDYPRTFNSFGVEDENDPLQEVCKNVERSITMLFIQITAPYSYHDRYHNYCDAFRFNALGKNTSTDMCKAAIYAFRKYDNVRKMMLRCNLSGMDDAKLKAAARQMNSIPGDITVEFAVEIPLWIYRQLAAQFSTEQMELLYVTGLNRSLAMGMMTNCLKIPEPEFGTENEEEAKENIASHFEAYSVRLHENDLKIITAINTLQKDQVANDITSTYSLINGMYKMRCILSINLNLKCYYDPYNSYISEFLEHLVSLAEKVNQQLNETN